MPGVPPHNRNLEFGTPDSKQNLAYHMAQPLPRHGEGYMGCRTPPPPRVVDQALEVVS